MRESERTIEEWKMYAQILNREAIKERFLLANNEFSNETLGKDLTPTEERFYRALYRESLRSGSVTGYDLYKTVYGCSPHKDINLTAVISQALSRVKDKLGENSIITCWPRGYLSRRALVEVSTSVVQEILYPNLTFK